MMSREYNLLLWNSHITCRSRLMEEDHNLWIKVTKHVSFVLCQATYKVGSYKLNKFNVCVSLIHLSSFSVVKLAANIIIVYVLICLQAPKLKEQRHRHQNGVEIQLRVMLASSLQRLII